MIGLYKCRWASWRRELKRPSFNDLSGEDKEMVFWASSNDVLVKPIADLNLNKTTHYYYGYYTGLGYFRYDFLENGDLVN